MKTRYFLFIGMIILFFLSACGNTNANNSSEVTHFAYQEVENGKWGFMSVEGEVVVQPTFQDMPTPVTDDMFFVPRQDGTYELHNINEPEKIINANYTDVSSFSEGKAFVTRKGENISCSDKKGNVLFTLSQSFIGASTFSNGYSIVYAKDELGYLECGYIDSKGTLIVPCQYEYASYFRNERAFVLSENSQFLLIDKKGTKLTSINSDNSRETILCIRLNGEIWAAIEDDIIPYVANGAFGLKNMNGQIIMEATPKYEVITRSWNGYRIYKTENGYGIMDNLGKELIKDKYSFIGTCNTNNSKTFVACIDNKWGILSMNEKQLCPFSYEHIIGFPQSSHFIAIKDGRTLLITKTGEVKRQFYRINTNNKGDIMIENNM